VGSFFFWPSLSTNNETGREPGNVKKQEPTSAYREELIC
jgi:hypothetical protein